MKTSRRITAFVLAIIISLCALPAIAFAEEEHEHSFTLNVTLEPTCTDDGSAVNLCECGYEEDVVLPAAHSFVTETVEANCTEPAKEISVCSVCGASEEKMLGDALGHDFGEWAEITSPTCIEDGVKQRICPRCSEVEEEVIPAVGHNFGDWTMTLPSSCTENGTKERVCLLCSAVEEESIPAAHTYESDAVYFSGSCTEDERTERYCSVCEQNIITVITAAPGHDWSEWDITITPTCTSEGQEMHICLECRAYEKRATPMSEHPFADWQVVKVPTYLEKGEKIHVCISCSFSETEELDILPNPFTDVKANKWYTAPILHCLQYGYMVGTTDTAFSLSQPVTRATIVQIMAKLAGADLDLAEYQHSVFTDVADGKWYTAAITWANKNGMASGIGDNAFGYKKNVTREEIAVFLKKLAVFTGRDTNAKGALGSSYEDIGRVHSWAYDALDWAISAGVMKGSTSKHLSPRIELTRAQLAEIIYNFDTKLPDKDILKPIAPPISEIIKDQ